MVMCWPLGITQMGNAMYAHGRTSLLSRAEQALQLVCVQMEQSWRLATIITDSAMLLNGRMFQRLPVETITQLD